jgi:hypothetical protein
MSARDYEYGGIYTSINGLTNWLETNLEIRGNSNDRREKMYKIIISYAIENIPGFKKRGHASIQADYIAKKIHKNKKFNHFAQWVLRSGGVDLSAAPN